VSTEAKGLYEITGFAELQAKIKKLGNEKDKRKPILAILRKSAKSTIDVAKRLAPKDSGVGAKSIKFQALRRARVPMGIVGPRSLGKYDGWYMRQFVIPGHNIYRAGFKRNRKGNAKANLKGAKKRVPANFFMNRAKETTERQVIGKAIPQTEKFIQKQIDKL
jgi:hypothetical protein